MCVLQVGSPFAGKTTVARSVAHMFGLKLLTPEQLVSDAVVAAQAWEQQQASQQPELPASDQEQQQQQQRASDQSLEQHLDEAAEAAAAAAKPPKQVLLGQRALQELQQGASVSDASLVELLMQGMQQAKDCVPPPPEPPPAQVKGTKGGKGAAKTEPETSTAGGRGSTGGAANPASSTAGGMQGSARGGADLSVSGGAGSAVLPVHLAAAAGTQGRGFVIDGFPATAEQAVLLEKALTGLDLAAEQALVDGASLVAPPPLDVLPQLQRPLLSGLDAVLVLGCADEAVAAKRALGRRLDPTTGELSHSAIIC
jgi:adenylate kinase family enzyme